MKIQFRRKIEVNTDPLRRCYDGHHFSSEVQWTDWADLMTCNPKRGEWWLAYWRRLNDYAVKERGFIGAHEEYRLVD